MNLSTETVRLPLYPGDVAGKRVWYVLLDASDSGAAHDLGVNYAPKLANLAIGDPAAVQTVTLAHPTPAQNRFGPADVHFQGAPDFSPTRVAVPGPHGFPLARFAPGAVAGPGYSPFIRIAGSPTVYNAPIVATGSGPFDVVHHTDTEDRVLGVHIAPPSPPGQFLESWADLLFIKGFDAGQPIVYLSTDGRAAADRGAGAGHLRPGTQRGVVQRRRRLPRLRPGAAVRLRQRPDRWPQPAGAGLHPPRPRRPHRPGRLRRQHRPDQRAARRRRPCSTSSVTSRPWPTPATPTPTARCGTPSSAGGPTRPSGSASTGGRSTRTKSSTSPRPRPDLLTGVDPATGRPTPYGSVGVDINCAVIGYTAQAPTANLAPPAPHSQFPPR